MLLMPVASIGECEGLLSRKKAVCIRLETALTLGFLVATARHLVIMKLEFGEEIRVERPR